MTGGTGVTKGACLYNGLFPNLNTDQKCDKYGLNVLELNSDDKACFDSNSENIEIIRSSSVIFCWNPIKLKKWNFYFAVYMQQVVPFCEALQNSHKEIFWAGLFIQS